MLYTGPLAWRPADELGVAVGETHVNPRVAEVERMQNASGAGPVGVQTSEWASEVFYNIHVKGWLDVRPSVQYVVAPGGVSHNTNDLIAGLRLSLSL
jgi:porin